MGRIQKKYTEYLGEDEEITVIETEEREYYKELKEKIGKIYAEHRNERTEGEYREILKGVIGGEIEETEERIEEEKGYRKRRRIEIGKERIVMEINKNNNKENINDLANYMKRENIVMGVIIALQKRDYDIHMILKEEMIEGCEYLIYNGREVHKYNIHESKEKKKQRQREEIERMIEEGESYVGISRKMGEKEVIIKKLCEKYGIQSQKAKRLAESRERPEDYIEILEDVEKYKRKQKECIKKIKEISKLKEIEEEEKGIYGIFNRTTKECIYIGSSDNCIYRRETHKQHYETEKKQLCHRIMEENGGWDNYIFLMLEKRDNHKGLHVIEEIWYETIKPVGNIISPMKSGKPAKK